MTKMKKFYIQHKFFSYVVPSVAAMWVYTIYTLVDGIFVARGVCKEALAAVNLSMPMINVAFALGILFAVGASTRASIYKGQGDKSRANRVFTLSTITVACIGLAVMAIISINISTVASILGATEETMEYVVDYLGIIIMFVPFYMTSYNLEVLIKADGFPKKAIATSIAGALTNVGLDYVFVILLS
ncbi:MAG: MATE family efflux transporter, partial [Clostridiales bacterium]|nr:MATE family efflux transporter [Clostridiales bacterium]